MKHNGEAGGHEGAASRLEEGEETANWLHSVILEFESAGEYARAAEIEALLRFHEREVERLRRDLQ